jgi:hypothetical protein
MPAHECTLLLPQAARCDGTRAETEWTAHKHLGPMSAQARDSASAAQRLHAMSYICCITTCPIPSPRAPGVGAPQSVSCCLAVQRASHVCHPCRMQVDRYGWFGSYFGRGFDALVASELRSLQRVRPRTLEASIWKLPTAAGLQWLRSARSSQVVSVRHAACDRRHAARTGQHRAACRMRRAATRPPQIFVYDLPSRFNTDITPLRRSAIAANLASAEALLASPSPRPLLPPPPPTRPHAHAARARFGRLQHDATGAAMGDAAACDRRANATAVCCSAHPRHQDWTGQASPNRTRTARGCATARWKCIAHS